MKIPPKWLREKIVNNKPLSHEEQIWLKRQNLLSKNKQELVNIIMELRR